MLLCQLHLRAYDIKTEHSYLWAGAGSEAAGVRGCFICACGAQQSFDVRALM